MTETSAPPLDPDQPGFVNPLDPNQSPVGDQPAAQEDYFGFGDVQKWYLPDRVSYMTVQALNEGAKSDFQKKTQTDVTLARGSGDARFRMNPAEERHALIMESVIDWNMKRGGNNVPLSTNANNNKKNLEDWLKLANPKLVEDLEKFIRKMNPWLLGEMTVADIDKQIGELNELREEAVKREAGEGYSVSK